MRSRLTILLLVILAGASFGVYRWWLDYRVESLEAACKAAIESEDWDTLEAKAEAMIRVAPDNGNAWLYLANASVQQEDFERAAECLKHVPDDHPMCALALLERVEMLFAKLNLVELAENVGSAPGTRLVLLKDISST